jgi:hypothetical protein
MRHFMRVQYRCHDTRLAEYNDDVENTIDRDVVSKELEKEDES